MGTICAPKYANILWEDLKETSDMRVFKNFQIFFVDLLMINFYTGMERKRDC